MIVAVTGTSGKTSVADFARQIFAALGRKAASLGTIGVIKSDSAVYGSLTTPDPVSLHQTLAGLADEGITHLAMEASSHGLDQFRLDGVRLTAAAFTNLGRDHLDYHATIEDYLRAKLRLFTEVLGPGGTAVVFIDDGHDLAPGGPVRDVLESCRRAGRKVLTVGIGCGEIACRPGVERSFPQVVMVSVRGQHFETRLPLIGAYQRDNALTAAGLAIAAGCGPEAVFSAFAGLQGVPGRLELVDSAASAPVLVDYAHKPDALERVLAELRQDVGAGGRLICVFGCGGDRDRGKRPIMGDIAARLADVAIVTDDNPRSEAPAAIRAEILAGVEAVHQPKVREIGDREAAIGAAVAMARAGDVVVVAGKGHETGQIIGDTVIAFSDHEAIRRAVQRIKDKDAKA